MSVLTINYFCEALPHSSFHLCFQAFRMAKGKPVLQEKRWINNTLGLNQGALEDVSRPNVNMLHQKGTRQTRHLTSGFSE